MKVAKPITVIILIIFIVWMVRDPGYEPLIGIIGSTGALFGEILFPVWNRKRPAHYFYYALRVEAVDEGNLIKDLSEKFIPVKDYKVLYLAGELSNILLRSISSLDHQAIYEFVLSFTEQNGGKIYWIEGEGSTFGIEISGEPPIYFNQEIMS
ncbi:MAG: hypothetical protein ACR2MX_10245 [Cyclobacteriaceae bacterium]